MKKSCLLTFLLVMILILAILPDALADDDLKAMTDQELLSLRTQVNNEINSRATSGSVPYWDGTNKVIVYDDEYITISFKGFYRWTSDWYIPNILIDNKTDRTLNFDWSKVFINRSAIGAANGGAIEMLSYSTTSFPTASKKCSITMLDYVEAYDESIMTQFQMRFDITDANKKTIKTGEFEVRCNIDILELISE